MYLHLIQKKKYLNDVLKMSIQTDDPDVGKITRS